MNQPLTKVVEDWSEYVGIVFTSDHNYPHHNPTYTLLGVTFHSWVEKVSLSEYMDGRSGNRDAAFLRNDPMFVFGRKPNDLIDALNKDKETLNERVSQLRKEMEELKKQTSLKIKEVEEAKMQLERLHQSQLQDEKRRAEKAERNLQVIKDAIGAEIFMNKMMQGEI